jgi:hypothetical protein
MFQLFPCIGQISAVGLEHPPEERIMTQYMTLLSLTISGF